MFVVQLMRGVWKPALVFVQVFFPLILREGRGKGERAGGGPLVSSERKIAHCVILYLFYSFLSVRALSIVSR